MVVLPSGVHRFLRKARADFNMHGDVCHRMHLHFLHRAASRHAEAPVHTQRGRARHIMPVHHNRCARNKDASIQTLRRRCSGEEHRWQLFSSVSRSWCWCCRCKCHPPTHPSVPAGTLGPPGPSGRSIGVCRVVTSDGKPGCATFPSLLRTRDANVAFSLSCASSAGGFSVEWVRHRRPPR